SFKSAAALNEFPPQLLPYGQKTVVVTGHEIPLPLYRVTLPDGTTRELAEVRRIGIQATLVDPKAPEQEYKVNIRDRKPVREFQLALNNYIEISASSRSAPFSGTAYSSRWLRRSSRCCSTRWRRSHYPSIDSVAATQFSS